MNGIVYCEGKTDTESNSEHTDNDGNKTKDGNADEDVLVTESGGKEMDNNCAESKNENLNKKLDENVVNDSVGIKSMDITSYEDYDVDTERKRAKNPN
uniref:Uncharacterized protein n=1 Tax=Tanacetum cinerariifolium TaxID=118510 RepID=A0A6L2LQF5_TANCI|nr:hypothetical protein [Tanacetum cinerariifolium]